MADYAGLVKVLREGAEWAEKVCAYDTAKRQSDAADAIEELLAKNTNVPNKWISVEERLPEINQPVLICAFGRSVGEGTYYGHDGVHHVWKMYCVAGTYWDDEVTHWMPLPEPPKGGIKQNVE